VCTRLAGVSDKAYQLLFHGQWFSPGTPAFSTTKTGRQDIAENIAESAVKHNKSNQSNLYKGHPFLVPPWKISYEFNLF
jgi:hypothetical protein